MLWEAQTDKSKPNRCLQANSQSGLHHLQRYSLVYIPQKERG